MKSAKIISLGYERRSVEEIIDILNSYKIKRLLDIRESPHSRRKGFSKVALTESLAEAGIKYIHIREAGNPYRTDKEDLKRCLRLYKSYLKKHPDIIDLVTGNIRKRGTAFFCYERSHSECHRSVLLEVLQNSGQLLEVIKVE